jgi:P4 family phage/plasmid primase-like protien
MSEIPAASKTPQHKSSMIFNEYLKKHFIHKGTENYESLEKTNTRIKDAKTGVSGGTYHIPYSEYDAFLRLYYNEVIRKGGNDHLTEKQLETGAPIVIDVDMRYDYDLVTERKHTVEHVIDLICLYLEELKEMFQFQEGVHIPIFVFEKSTVNRVNSADKKRVTKDGIHIIIGLKTDRLVQTILRERILGKIADVWTDLPLTNTWSDVFDEGISKGGTNWQLYGSCKPQHEPYALTHVYDVHLDPTDGEIVMPEIPTSVYQDSEDKFLQLSVRYRHHPELFMSNTFIAEYQAKKGVTGGGGVAALTRSMSLQSMPKHNGIGMVPTEIFNVRSAEQLQQCVEAFLDSLTSVEYELREAYEYTMALPKSYYSAGSFTKWIRVGWALRNISSRLFIVWVAFSAQAEGFSYTSIRDDLWERWSSFSSNGEGITKRSIMYWVKQECPERYKEVHGTSVENFIDMTLESTAAISNCSDKKATGSGDYDIATVLYQLFRDQYKCVSIKANIWYRFKEHKWEEIDSGTTLRKAISDELRNIYFEKLKKLMRQKALLNSQEGEEKAEKLKHLQVRIELILSIIGRLSKTNDKKNIMTEAKELFFDPMFFQHLDNNPYLLCFKNGVVDFKQKTFRKGQPEDYLSKCTNINYITIDPIKHAQTVEEIKDFMHKLFPDPELHKYMWEHLASTLVGNNMNQTFNMYIGVGSNGKSILVNLMEQTLGDYKGDVPLTLLTQQRTRIGGLSPELVALKGVRYAVMQEPSKGDRINEGIMKQVTGGDPIQARAPYMPQMVNYIPQFKLVVCSNEFMEIRSQDNGTRRRIRVVDFESLFTENPVDGDKDKPHQFKLDKSLKERFEYWREIFASMLVDIAYKTNGNVEDVNRVMTSSNNYLDRQDFIAEYVGDRLEVCETGCVQKDHLIRDFNDWFGNHVHGKCPNSRDLVEALEKKFGKMKNNIWRGIRFQVRVPSGANSANGDNDDSATIDTKEGVSDDADVDLQEI